MKKKVLSSVITGASGVLGSALAREFAADGHLLITGRNEARLDHLQASLPPGKSTILLGDLDSLVVQDKVPALADIYNCKYLVLAASPYKRISLYGQDIDTFMDCASCHMYLIKNIVRILHRTNGTIIHINSTAGKNASPEEAAYSASKHAMAGFLKAIRPELRIKGIRVLDVFLGAFKSPITEYREDYTKLMEPAEIANIIHNTAVNSYDSFQIEELTIGRINI